MVPRSLRPPSGRLDIFAMHTRLNVPELSKIVHPDSMYITAVREPPFLYESLYNYFNLTGFHGKTLEQYLEMPLEVS